MKTEAWIFGLCSLFFAIVTVIYWVMSADPTGMSALTMTFLLLFMVSMYLGFHAKNMSPRPEDRREGEIADGAGELGFFPPYSWWPLWCAATLGVIVLGVVIGWWMVIIGFGLGAIALSGWVFEFYRGVHAH